LKMLKILKMFSVALLLIVVALNLIESASGPNDCPCSGHADDESITPCIDGRCNLGYTDADYTRLLARLIQSHTGQYNSILAMKLSLVPRCVRMEVDTLSDENITIAIYDPLQVRVSRRDVVHPIWAKVYHDKHFVEEYCSLKGILQSDCKEETFDGILKYHTCYNYSASAVELIQIKANQSIHLIDW